MKLNFGREEVHCEARQESQTLPIQWTDETFGSADHRETKKVRFFLKFRNDDLKLQHYYI